MGAKAVAIFSVALFCLVQAGDLDIYRLHVVSDIAYRFATTNVTSYLANRASEAREAEFKLTIPDAAFINKFFMVIDGEIYHGTVKEKGEAQKEYDEAKKQGQSAGQVRRRSNTKENIFEVQVNIAAESKVEFSLTYQELLQRKLGIYEHLINLDPGQVVNDLVVEVNIRESRKIVLLEVPELKEEHQNSIVRQENPHVVVERPSDTEAKVTYSPDSSVQKEASKDGIAGQFVVEYDVERTQSGGDILVVDGYFVHFFAPSGLDPVAKDIVFVLDISGSMSGNKLSQLKVAMDKIVGKMMPQDRFNIITFATNSEIWEPEGLIEANPANVARAQNFVRNLYTKGSTNINDALLQGISHLKTHKITSETTKRPAVVIFLTDGMPNQSESNTTKIAMNLVAANQGYASVFSLGFGNDVDFNFLKSLSLQNDGFARKIYVNADPALQLENFYTEVSTPLLTEVNITYMGNTVDQSTVTPTCFLNFFNGTEIVVAGKLMSADMGNVVSQVSAGAATGLIELDAEASNATEAQNLTTVFNVNKFTERLWAYLTIKKMLDTKHQTTDKNDTAEANQKALDLALQYQFVTPLTSMVVTKPNDTENQPKDFLETPLYEDASLSIPNLGAAGPGGPSVAYSPHYGGYARASMLGGQPGSPSYSWTPLRASGISGSQVHSFAFPSPRRRVAYQPRRPTKGIRFQTTTTTPQPGTQQRTCLEVQGTDGDIYQLVYDKQQGIVMNGRLKIPSSQSVGNIVFSQIAVMHSRARVLVKPTQVRINNQRYSWTSANGRTVQGIALNLTASGDFLVSIGSDFRVQIKQSHNYIEIVDLQSQLEPSCDSQKSGTDGWIYTSPTEVQITQITLQDGRRDCIKASDSSESGCQVHPINQWVYSNGQNTRYYVPRIYHRDHAVEYF